MKKLFISTANTIILILIFILGALNFAPYKNTPTPCFSDLLSEQQNSNSNYADSVIALLLYDEIDKAIQEYYGTPTQFALYDAKITEIGQVNNEFKFTVTIEVPTFNGPHNPPYGLEILTFTVSPAENILDSFVHKSLPN